MADNKRQKMSGPQDYYGGGGPYGGGAGGGYGGHGGYGGGGGVHAGYGAAASGYGGPGGGYGEPSIEMGGNGAGYGAAGGYGGSPMGMGMGVGGAGAGNDAYGSSGYEGGGRFFPAVKLRGLPFQCNEDDVRIFLALETVDVLMVKKNGRFNGEALVVLGQPAQVDYALQKNKMNMGRRYVEVFKAKRWEYYRAVAAEVMEDQAAMGYHDMGGVVGPGGGGAGGGGFREPRGGDSMPRGPPPIDHENAEHTGVLKLRGLPFSATPDDIVRWFVDPSITLSGPVVAENVAIVFNHEGRSSGTAFVEFASPDDSKQAMVKDRQMLGSRYIELFPSSREDMARATGLGPSSSLSHDRDLMGHGGPPPHMY